MKVKGKKRHILVDTQCLLMEVVVHATNLQYRDVGVLLMGTLFPPLHQLRQRHSLRPQPSKDRLSRSARLM